MIDDGLEVALFKILDGVVTTQQRLKLAPKVFYESVLRHAAAGCRVCGVGDRM
jgi:hypothetical protein